MESAKVYLLNRNQLERSPLMTVAMTASRPKLLDQAIRTRHYSPRTEETYAHWIRRLILFHNKRHPACYGVMVSDLPKSTNFDISALCPAIPESMHKDCSIT